MKEKESVETLPARAHDLWAPAAQMATVGIFIILAGACLYFCRTVLLPVTVALVIGATLAPLVLMFVTLVLFLAAQMDFRRYMVSFFSTRDGKLRFIRIANDVEENLASYLAIVTVINIALGVTTAIGAWLFGFPNAILFG